jgi:uncharacterized protein HemY
MAHHTLGLLALDEGRYDDANTHFARMLSLTDEIGHLGYQAYAHHLLARVQLRRGEPTTHLELAEAAARRAEMIDIEIQNLRAEVQLAAGAVTEAVALYRAALAESIMDENRHREAQTRLGLAAALATIDPSEAVSHERTARTLFEQLKIPVSRPGAAGTRTNEVTLDR